MSNKMSLCTPSFLRGSSYFLLGITCPASFMLTTVNKESLPTNFYPWAELSGARQWGPTLNNGNLRYWQFTSAGSLQTGDSHRGDAGVRLGHSIPALCYQTSQKTQFYPETRVLMLQGHTWLWSSIFSHFISKKMFAGLGHNPFSFSQICQGWFWWRTRKRNFDDLKYEVKDYIINRGGQNKGV